LHVAAGFDRPVDVSKLRNISRAQLALHNSPGDLWVALGDCVFDITIVSSFHPGGEKVLIYRAGSQAEEAFGSVHNGDHGVDSLLNQMIIGRLALSRDEFREWEQHSDNIVQIQNGLTNNSRLEQIPTGSSDQLRQAPPADVIRKSLDGFVES
jgi:hypothetical protein